MAATMGRGHSWKVMDVGARMPSAVERMASGEEALAWLAMSARMPSARSGLKPMPSMAAGMAPLASAAQGMESMAAPATGMELVTRTAAGMESNYDELQANLEFFKKL